MAENENDPPRNRPWDKGDREDRNDRDPPRRRRDNEDDDDDDDRPRRRRYEDDDDYDDRSRRRGSGAAASNGLATAGLILGVPSLCLGPLLGVPALICSGIALSRPGGRNAAVAGLILGGIGTLLTPVLLVALLLPAVSKVRGAAARMNDSNNLKQISLGTLNYHDSNGTLPPATDDNLSWRYYILPHIEQDSVFRAMNPRERWDGPTNKRFADTRIKTFVSATDPPEEVQTRYRVFVGPNTLYPPGQKPPRMTEITDGISNTIWAVEAADRVPWPQPKELPFDRAGPLPKLGGPHSGGFLVAMVDGSVRFVSEKTSPDMIRNGIDPRDGRGFDP